MTGLPQYRQDPRRILCVRDCLYCGGHFPVARKYPQQRFCSRRCGFRATVTKEHQRAAGLIGGKVRADAVRGKGSGRWYPKIGKRHAHRVIAEKKLGRPLRPGEIVHHRDDNKMNYRAGNLRVFPSQAAHMRHHARARKR